MIAKCPSCSAEFEIGKELEGKYGKCSSCSKTFLLPKSHAVKSRDRQVTQRRPSGLSAFMAILLTAGFGAGVWGLFRYLPIGKTVEDGISMESAVGGWLPFLGNLHPLLLHLPIGLILVTGLLEIFSLKKRREVLAPAITTLLWLSAISCILSVGTGWLMAVGKPAEITLDRHLWLTVILTALVLITLNFKVIFEIGEGKGTRLGYRISLVASIGLLSLAAHQGGSMVHGKDHLTEHLPEDIKLVAEQGEEAIENAFTLVGLGDPEQMEAAAVAAEGGLPTGVAEGPEEEALAAADVDKTVFEGVILPILEGKCTKCHNEKKSKGKLRMHTFEHLMAGGSEGDTIVPGDLAASLLAVRIDLPLEDDEAMPPEDEKPLTEEEKELLKWWITNGASSEMLLAEAEVPAELETAWNNLIAPPEAIADAASETEVVPIEAVARSYSDQEISEAKRTLSEKIGGTAHSDVQRKQNPEFQCAECYRLLRRRTGQRPQASLRKP